MQQFVFYLAYVLAFLGGAGLGYYKGFGRGLLREKERCISLVSQSWRRKGEKLSPTARRIYHSIERDHVELISDAAFFGVQRHPKAAPNAEIDILWTNHCPDCRGLLPGCVRMKGDDAPDCSCRKSA